MTGTTSDLHVTKDALIPILYAPAMLLVSLLVRVATLPYLCYV
jgi:hypothetical protein